MARFYARFDAGTETGLGVGSYFNKLRIHSGSASAAPYRDGLIASRSLLSTDVYEDLNSVNRDGSVGTFFPADNSTVNIPSNFVSWSTAFTSSFEGIRIQTNANNNVYGGVASVNYSLRPTGSISYSQSAIIGQSDPLDPIGVAYTTYYSASQAVRDTINTIQTTQSNNVISTPFTRTGNTSSLTLHSLWHDPDLQYFAWDDYTPGAPGTQAPGIGGYTCDSGTGTITQTLTIYWSKEYENDWNPNGKLDIQIDYISNNGATNQFDDFLDFDVSGSGTSGIYRTFTYNSRPLSNNGGTVNYDFHITMSYRDAIRTAGVTASRGVVTRYNAGNFINAACSAAPPPPGPPPPVPPPPPAP